MAARGAGDVGRGEQRNGVPHRHAAHARPLTAVTQPCKAQRKAGPHLWPLQRRRRSTHARQGR
eukprot:scaffold280629_cov36-Tisochrysis_lutea.AAC.3